jgi:hypothetical protein
VPNNVITRVDHAEDRGIGSDPQSQKVFPWRNGRTCELAYSLMRELGLNTINGSLVTAVVQEGRLAQPEQAPAAASA